MATFPGLNSFTQRAPPGFFPLENPPPDSSIKPSSNPTTTIEGLRRSQTGAPSTPETHTQPSNNNNETRIPMPAEIPSSNSPSLSRWSFSKIWTYITDINFILPVAGAVVTTILIAAAFFAGQVLTACALLFILAVIVFQIKHILTLGTYKEENEKYKQLNKEHQREIQQLRTEREHFAEENATYAALNEQLEAERKSFADQNELYLQRNAELRTNIQSLQTKLTTLQNIIDDIKDLPDKMEQIEQVKTQLATVQTQLETVQKKLAEETTKLEAIRQCLEKSSAAYEESLTRHSSLLDNQAIANIAATQIMEQLAKQLTSIIPALQAVLEDNPNNEKLANAIKSLGTMRAGLGITSPPASPLTPPVQS